ncbi:MAG: DNA gyrase subunit A [Caldilineaceae bacterium SB0661_bin_32]|uniref:DNA topoisomerase (ATP-hydrolyzing) n=1 Tax=Caldilineaceae bacterium SB0661_bin_32 TaxID=2605255 RepID=A0A6B1DD21_9CHLR|nr:DNA gyrase subunit A [Caldilineaceae bacterium SB0661_bin_32]
MIGTVREIEITTEMHASYLDYAMSVIVARALPDVRDGLKPVHRRILYAMHDMGVTSNKPYKKSARIVGEVLGKYHPHNDTSVYDAMVRMAQEFSLRYPLVDGQGNFGSIDGDNAAAMRYTEARLAAISDLMLADIEKDTIDWNDNFDTTLKEPAILPAALPNLLINGANGIAVGMATNIPPHNLAEVVDAAVYLIDHFDKIDEVGVNDLLQFIKGPDFPTGGILFRYRQGAKGEEEIDAVSQGYATGRARLIMQAKAHFEEMSRSRSRIVVTDLPYQTNKTNLLERIALLVRDGKIDGITDLRDESDRTGMRIVIELTRNVDPNAILARLLRLTPMQQTFGMSLLALVNGEPVTLTLKRILRHFIEHRQEIIRRRSQFDLAKAKARSHIVEGLLKALDILDEVISTIRRSQRVDTARTNLMRAFGFTQVQAQAILDMPLRRLTALERRQLQDEHKELQQLISYLEDLLSDDGKILGVIREELLALRQQHADRRRTQIVERAQGTLTATDLLPDRRVWVALGANGALRRQDFTGINRAGLRQAAQNAAAALLTANTRDQLFIFSASGRCYRLGVHELPQEGRRHLADLTDFSRRNTIASMLALPQSATEGFLFLVTRQGAVKRIALADFTQAALTALNVISVNGKDRLACALVTPGNGEIMLITRMGRSIRFPEEKVRAMGTAARGVAGINLKRDDEVIAALPVAPDGDLLTVTSAGYVKRTPINEFNLQGRGGGGIIAHKLDARTGDLVGAAMLTPEHAFAAFVTEKGVAKPLGLEDIPSSGRSALGSRKVDLAGSDAVAAVQAVSPVVAAMHSPPPPPDPQLNGRGDIAAPPPAKENQEKTEKAPAKKKPAAGTASAKSGKSGAQPKTRKLASETSKKPKPATSERTAPKQAAAKPANGELSSRNAKPRRKSRRNGAQETSPPADASNASTRRRKAGKTSEPEPDARRAAGPRQAKQTKRPVKNSQPERKRAAAASGNQSVQASLLDELAAKPKPAAAKTSTRAAGKGAGKLARVSSVTGGRKKSKNQ